MIRILYVELLIVCVFDVIIENVIEVLLNYFLRRTINLFSIAIQYWHSYLRFLFHLRHAWKYDTNYKRIKKTENIYWIFNLHWNEIRRFKMCKNPKWNNASKTKNDNNSCLPTIPYQLNNTCDYTTKINQTSKKFLIFNWLIEIHR